MVYRILIVTSCLAILVFFLQKASAQYPKTAKCQNPAFDKKVDSYLSYSVPVIDVEKAFLRKGEIIFLDAREKEEYVVSHIEDARLVGYDSFKMSNHGDIPKEKTIVIYCSIGYRSEKIAEKFKKAGYTQVYNLYGSIFEWVNRGYPVVNANGQVNQVHGYNKKWSQWVNTPEIRKIY